MTGTDARRVVLAAATAGVVVVTILASSASGAPAPKQPNVQLAPRTGSVCGAFVDELPPLMATSDVAAGTTVADVSVCIRNAGTADGRLALGAIELSDTDPECTGDEDSVDSSCGGGAAGELSPRLVQRAGVDSMCRTAPPTDPTLDRTLAQLAASPVVLASRLMKGKQLCARLVLRYEPDAAGTVAGQSDRTTWRYAFTLTTD